MGELFFKSMIKELTLVSFVQFFLSLFNFEPTRQFREKMSTKYSFRKERKVFHYHKDRKRFPMLYCGYLSIKSEATRRFNWKNSLKVLNEFFFSVGKRQKSFRCSKLKLSFGIIVPLVLKLSLTGIIMIILKGEKFKVNYGIVIF